MNELDYRGLAALDAVVDYGSFDKAAAALSVTQSAVSQRLRILENQRGELLIVRSQPPRATEAGQRLIKEWRGQPVWIVNRTKALLDTLPQVDTRLKDPKCDADQQPKFAKNETRSYQDKPQWLVVIGICTHLGCSPDFVPEIKPEPFDPEWKGGFFCPCHKSRYDISGRVFQGVPAPLNLVVPPYKFVTDNQILIGVGPEEKA